MAYNEIDPIGEWRDDLRIAKFECLLVNIVNALYHKEGEPEVKVTPADFMIKWGEDVKKPEPKVQSLTDMKDTLKTIFGGSKRKKVAKKIQPDKYQGR
jgi:hypothetical protein